MIKTTELYIFYISLDDLGLHARLQLNEKCKTLLSIFWGANLSVDLDVIQYVATTCWFVEAHAKFILLNCYSREIILLT